MVLALFPYSLKVRRPREPSEITFGEMSILLASIFREPKQPPI